MASGLWRRLAKAAVRLYPREWRARYEAEVLALLDATPPTWHVASDLLAGALRERSPLLFAPIWFLGVALRAFALTLLTIIVLAGAFVLLIGPFLSVRIGFDWSEWASRRIFDVPLVISSEMGMFLVYSLAFSLPVLPILLLPYFRLRHPKIARVIFTAAFAYFSFWLGGLSQQAAMLMCGWLIAMRLFLTSTPRPSAPSAFRPVPPGIDDTQGPSHQVFRRTTMVTS